MTESDCLSLDRAGTFDFGVFGTHAQSVQAEACKQVEHWHKP